MPGIEVSYFKKVRTHQPNKPRFDKVILDFLSPPVLNYYHLDYYL